MSDEVFTAEAIDPNEFKVWRAPTTVPADVAIPHVPEAVSPDQFTKYKAPQTVSPSGDLIPTTDIIPNVATGAVQAAVVDPLRAGGALANVGAQVVGYQPPFDTNEATIRSYLPGMMRAKPVDEYSQIANALGYGAGSAALLSFPLRGIGMLPRMGVARALGQAPFMSTTMGGVGGATGQYAENRAREAGLSEPAQVLSNVAGNILGGVPVAIGSSLLTTPLMTATGHYVRDTSRLMRAVKDDNLAEGIAGLQLNRAFGKLGNWAESNADVGDYLARQKLELDIDKSYNTALFEDIARKTVNDMGGFGTTSQYGAETANLIAKAFSPTATQFDKDIAEQTLKVEQQLGNIRPTMTMEDLGAEIRARSNIVRQRPTGTMGDILEKDSKGAFKVQNSDVPGMVFNNNLSEEDMRNMYRLSSPGFRRAFADAGSADFLNAVEKRGPNGERLGEIDPNKHASWMKRFSPLIENYERVTGDASVRDRFTSALNAQNLLDELKTQRSLLEERYAIRAGSSDADIANRFIKSGDKGGEAFQEYLKLTNGTPESIGNYSDLLASKIREAAVDKNTGLLDMTKFNRWADQHKSLVNSLPDEIKNNFMSAASAQKMLDTQSMIRSQAIRDYETSAASFYLGGQTPTQAFSQFVRKPTPEEAIKGVMSDKPSLSTSSTMMKGDPALKMRDLVDRVKGDPDALNGLRRDFMEYAVKQSEPDTKDTVKFLTNLKSFIKSNDKVVRELYDDQTVEGLNKIVTSAAGLKEGHKFTDILKSSATPLGALILADAGLEAVTAISSMMPFAGHGLVVGGAGLASGAVINHYKNAGIEKVNQLIIEAVRHPDLMKELTSTNLLKDKSGYTWQQRLGAKLAVLGTEAALSQNRPKQPVYPEKVKAKVPTIPGIVP